MTLVVLQIRLFLFFWRALKTHHYSSQFVMNISCEKGLTLWMCEHIVFQTSKAKLLLKFYFIFTDAKVHQDLLQAFFVCYDQLIVYFCRVHYIFWQLGFGQLWWRSYYLPNKREVTLTDFQNKSHLPTTSHLLCFSLSFLRALKIPFFEHRTKLYSLIFARAIVLMKIVGNRKN